MARLWLQVTEQHTGPGYGHPYELWWRDVTLEGTPCIGDKLMFLASEEEPDGSVDIDVKDRYWAIDGTLNVELRGVVHLPNEKMEADISHGVGAWPDHASYVRHVPVPWRETDDEFGLLDDRLASSGWHRWADL